MIKSLALEKFTDSAFRILKPVILKENYTQSVIKYWSEWVMAKSTALATHIYFALSLAKVQDQIFHAFSRA